MLFSFMTNFWADVLFTKILETQRLGVGGETGYGYGMQPTLARMLRVL